MNSSIKCHLSNLAKCFRQPLCRWLVNEYKQTKMWKQNGMWYNRSKAWNEKKNVAHIYSLSLQWNNTTSIHCVFSHYSYSLEYTFSEECFNLVRGKKRKNHIVHLFRKLIYIYRKNKSVLMEQKTRCSISIHFDTQRCILTALTKK